MNVRAHAAVVLLLRGEGIVHAVQDGAEGFGDIEHLLVGVARAARATRRGALRDA